MTVTVPEIMSQLQALGEQNIKKIWLKHGIKEPFFGVKIQNLKSIQKKIKVNTELAKGLFATGNADAMYLAGLIADDKQMTKADLQNWVQQAVSNNISEYTVPWVAAGSPYGFELGLEWIDSKHDHIAAAGWATLGGVAATKPDAELDLAAYRSLLNRAANTIHAAGNRVRYTMNTFVTVTGTYVKPLTDEAIATAQKIGNVTVDMNGTACKVPDAVGSIHNAQAKGVIGQKKLKLKC